jgi:hypothetical protein
MMLGAGPSTQPPAGPSKVPGQSVSAPKPTDPKLKDISKTVKDVGKQAEKGTNVASKPKVAAPNVPGASKVPGKPADKFGKK